MKDAAGRGPINRREFLHRTAKAGAIIAASGALSYFLYDPMGPGRTTDDASVVLPAFSVSGSERKMSIVTGEDRTKTLHAGLAALGGIEAFIKKGDSVVIKVNAAFASPASLSATTSPALVSETVKLCYKAGASTVAVTDNPINNPESCFALTGIGEAARSAGAHLILPKKSFFQPTTVPGAGIIRNCPILYKPFEGATKVIGIAPVKDHHRSGASMAMKNWYGLIGGRRNVFHQNIHEFIKELALMVRPTLVILDGTTTMMTNGPTGGSLSDLKQTNTMIISTDQVAADAFGATLLGKTAHDLPFILKAQEAGIGTADFESLHPVRASAG